MNTTKQIAIALSATVFAACASAACAQEARINVGDLSQSPQRAAFDQALSKTTTQFCGNRADNFGHLTEESANYAACVSAIHDEVFEQLSARSLAQYAAVAVNPVLVASAAR